MARSPPQSAYRPHDKSFKVYSGLLKVKKSGAAGTAFLFWDKFVEMTVTHFCKTPSRSDKLIFSFTFFTF
jgi:hypothetical protein